RRRPDRIQLLIDGYRSLFRTIAAPVFDVDDFPSPLFSPDAESFLKRSLARAFLRKQEEKYPSREFTLQGNEDQARDAIIPIGSLELTDILTEELKVLQKLRLERRGKRSFWETKKYCYKSLIRLYVYVFY